MPPNKNILHIDYPPKVWVPGALSINRAHQRNAVTRGSLIFTSSFCWANVRGAGEAEPDRRLVGS
jgi:hypothetical protein